MNGEEEWTDLEKALPRLESRPAEPALRSQSIAAAAAATAANSVAGSAASGLMTSSISMKSLGSVGSAAALSPVQTNTYTTTVAAAAYIPSWSDSVSGARGGGGSVTSIREQENETTEE